MLRLITPPAVLPISMAETLAYARLEQGDDDAHIAGLLRTATEMVEQMTGRTLITSGWEYRPAHFLWLRDTTAIRLPLAPVQSVDAITYVDPLGDSQVLSPTVYLTTGLPDGAAISWAPGQSWPSMAHQPEAVVVTFTAGYGDSWNDVPEPLRAAVGEMVRGLYDGCESGSVDELIAPYKMWVF